MPERKVYKVGIIPQSIRDYHKLASAGNADHYRNSETITSAVFDIMVEERGKSPLLRDAVSLWLLYRRT